MIPSESRKPKIKIVKEGELQIEDVEENSSYPSVSTSSKNNSDNSLILPEDKISSVQVPFGSSESNKMISPENLLYYFWLSPTSYILLAISIIVIILLGSQRVAFAGSAIYAVGEGDAFLVDLLAIILGMGALFILEAITQNYPIYDRLKFILFIRIISMLPSLIMGITLLLLFSLGVIPPENIYPFIFLIGLVMGTFTMTSGLHYLRAQPVNDALMYSIVPTFIDLLVGVVILLSI
jgi:hypothetical protein